MFFIVGLCFLTLLSATLFMLWAHEKIRNKGMVPHAIVEECWIGEERRKHKRFNKDLEIEYTFEKKPHIKNGRTINISQGGMKLLLDEKLLEGAILDLKVYIPGKKIPAEVEAEVVWTNEVKMKDPSGKRFFNSGIRFIVLKEPRGTNFCEYVRSLHG